MLIKRIFLAALLLPAVAGCTGEAPYVDRPYTINRELKTFPEGPAIVDGSSVIVCYAKSKATPASIRALAEAECARGGMAATFYEQTLDNCPLMAPIAAIFHCSGPMSAQKSGTPVQAGSLVPAYPAPVPAGAGRPVGSISAADVSTTAKSEPFPTFLFNKGQPSQ